MSIQMGGSRFLSTARALGFLGVVASAALGCKNSPEIITAEGGKEPAVVVKANQVNVTTASSATTKTPLLVRGGAMTFSTTGTDGWGTGGGIAAPFCTSIDTSYVALERFNADTAPVNGPILDVQGYYVPWVIQIYGHKKKGYDGSAGNNGVVLTSQPKDCSQGAGATSVALTFLNNEPNNFYGAALPLNGDFTANVRFKDGDCNDDDRDICERMAKITVSINGSAPTTYKCKDGNCSLHIGHSQ